VKSQSSREIHSLSTEACAAWLSSFVVLLEPEDLPAGYTDSIPQLHIDVRAFIAN